MLPDASKEARIAAYSLAAAGSKGNTVISASVSSISRVNVIGSLLFAAPNRNSASTIVHVAIELGDIAAYFSLTGEGRRLR